MSNNYYVLMSSGWDYNDEVFFRSESSGGNPEKIFTDEAKAHAVCDRENMGEFKRLVVSGEIHEYSYSLNDILSDKATDEDRQFEGGIFMQMFGKTAEDWWDSHYNRSYGDRGKNNVVGEPTEEQWKKLYNCFAISFYEIVECEGADHE